MDADYKLARKENMSNHACCKNPSSNSSGLLKPILFIVVVPALVILAIILLTANGGNKAEGSVSGVTQVESVDSTYKLDKLHYSFGTISQKNGNVETEYTLTNTGNADIFVKKLYSSCMCTKAQIIFSDGSKTSLNGMLGHELASDLIVDKSIKAGETVKIRAVFDPNAHGPEGVGFIKRNVTLETNLKTSPIIQVSFDATVTK